MTRNSKQRALDSRQFELLMRGVRRIDTERQQREAEFAVLLTGRLGMRSGELIHLTEDWINWREQRIEIPRHQDCHLGGEEQDCCGYCSQAARQIAAHYDPEAGMARTQERLFNRLLDDGFTNGDPLTFEDASQLRWFAKTDAAARSIPFDWHPRTEIAIERFFERGRDGWNLSKTALNRRINKALSLADELDKDSTMPHGLRATAASYHSSRGVPAITLQSLMGWADMQTARRYIRQDGDTTSRSLHQAHSM